MFACFDEGKAGLDGLLDDLTEIRSFFAQFDFASCDAADIHEIVDEPHHLLQLPLDHGAGDVNASYVIAGQFHELQTVADWCKWIAKLVSERGKKLVFSAVSLLKRLLGLFAFKKVGRLPCEKIHQALVAVADAVGLAKVDRNHAEHDAVAAQQRRGLHGPHTGIEKHL